MSVPARMRRAGAMTLLVHALRCAAALLIASPLLSAWQPLLDLNLYRAQPSAADAALVLETAAVLGPDALRWTGACGALYLLLAPLLTLSWLSAMTDLRTFRAQLARAARRYASGLLLSIATWLVYALCVGLLWFALQPERFALLPATASFEQLAFAGAVATAALLLLITATASDLAFAALASAAPAAALGLAACARRRAARAVAGVPALARAARSARRRRRSARRRAACGRRPRSARAPRSCSRRR